MPEPKIDKSEKALLLFSGGQDSTTCLAWALTHYRHVETIGFEYGQRHEVEMRCRPDLLSTFKKTFPDWAHKLGDDHVLDLQVLGQISETALTRKKPIMVNEHGIPTTFVPGRNLIFLNFAAAFAYNRDMEVLVGGMCETDFSGYPDCREENLDLFMSALSQGMGKAFALKTPLMLLDKAQIWAKAAQLGGGKLVELIKQYSHSCYLGVRGDLHEWGYGCATCPACDLRAKGWQYYQAQLSS